MEYQIYYGGELIAEFKYEADRDYCLDMLQEIHPDVDLKTELEVR